MIALTQEKREELINRCRKFASINAKRGFIGVAEEECDLIHRIALASLTAEEVNQVIFNNHLDDGYVEWADCNKDYFNRNPSDYRRVLYTAPPVPEIKLPHELMDLVNAVEFYHAVKAENPATETGMWRDACDWIKKAAVEAAPVIKRLNGLGE